MNEIGKRLLQVFDLIHQTRMQGLPIINPALQVAVVGFESNDQDDIGVLVTPWCMNLVRLPLGDEWDELQPGSKYCHELPSGEYEFVVGEEPGLGRFQSCSLFSPMFQFADQAAAVATAEASLRAVMTEKIDSLQSQQKAVEKSRRDLSRRDFLGLNLFR